MRAMNARRKKLLEAFRREIARAHITIDPKTKSEVALPINSWLRDPKIVEAFERAIAAADPKADAVYVEVPKKPATVIEFDGARDQWEKTGDPRWVWRAIRDRRHRREPLPNWIWDYLGKCAEGIETAKGDVGRKLHRILGFKPGRGLRLRDVALDLRDEQFAMAFAGEVLRGVSPGKARSNASVEVDGAGGKDDKDLRQRLTTFFKLNKLPKEPIKKFPDPTEPLPPPKRPTTQSEWKLFLAVWLARHPGLIKHYNLPPIEFGPSPRPRG
jgi:hypothetical protein